VHVLAEEPDLGAYRILGGRKAGSVIVLGLMGLGLGQGGYETPVELVESLNMMFRSGD
jgi:hypothetical protein